MDRDEPEPTNPLSPYYPSQVPSIGGYGRRWFAVLFPLLFVAGLVATVLALLL